MREVSRRRLCEVVRGFRHRRVLVVGDVMLDEYVWGDVSRISPEAPIPIVEEVRESARPGGAANVLADVREHPGEGSIVGPVGDEATAESLRALLSSPGVDISGLVVDRTRPTSLKRRVVARGQQMLRVDRESSAVVEGDAGARIVASARDAVLESEAVIVSDYGKGVITRELIDCVVTVAGKMGKPVAVDPKRSCLDVYRGATVITPNHQEVELFMGVKIVDEDGLKEAGRRMLKELDARAVLITRGEQGMLLVEPEGAVNIPAVAREVYDVTGAGDTVIAALVLGLVSGASMLEGAHVANYAAGLVVGKVGTATVNSEELLSELNGPG